jgi:hypothetical protein
MRRVDDGLLEPEIAETLRAIDETLAGKAVDPRFADVAELSLLLAADRPAPRTDLTRSLDARLTALGSTASSGERRRWWLPPSVTFGAAGVGALAAAVVLVALVSGGGGHALRPLARTATPAQAAGSNQAAPPARGSVGGSQFVDPLRPNTSSAPSTGAPAASSPGAPSTSSAAAGQSPSSLRPPPNGRKIVQSATLDLGVQPARVDDVAQEVLNVIGSVSGIVDHSTVTSTGGPDGHAQFELRVPSTSLAQTMSALSRLRYASVVSRTDNSQDVNSQFVDANRQLADASALRSTLLGQLAKATDQQQIDSIKAQLSAAEATIATAQATLRALNRQVSYSQVSVTIDAGSAPLVAATGFSLHSAARDALHILTVAAGVALIALAVMVPAGLLGAFGWWTFTAVRRRRREQALDLA